MKITKPAFYDRFRCIAGACPDSCCREWAVAIDEESAALYRALPGSLGQKLNAALQEEDGDIILSLEADGRCPMWQEDGLCRIHAELGEQALCQTCRQFPRLEHDYGNFMELGLELSCPEAARLILEGQSDELTEDRPGTEAPDYNTEAMDVLLDSRRQARALLSAPDLTVPEALAILLLYAHRVQAQLDGGEPAWLNTDADGCFLRGMRFQPGPDPLALCKELNILTDRWKARLEMPLFGSWTDQYRAMARYFVDRYWLQAVSDGDLVSRVKLAVFSCLVIRRLGGDLTQTAQLFSKEIENDAENVDAILDGAYAHPVLTDSNLLHLLMEAD